MDDDQSPLAAQASSPPSPPFHALAGRRRPPPPGAVRRFQCARPGCGKLFNRKEHLTRHLKSHDPHLQYECPVCRRRYARSDVLKRHVESHSQSHGSPRTLVACAPCRDRKLKCDERTPCRSCTRNATVCCRSGLGWESSNADGGRGRGGGGSRAVMLTRDVAEMDGISAALSGSDCLESWFPAVAEAWPPPPYLATDLSLPFPSHLDPATLTPWTVDSSSCGRVGDAFAAAAAADDASFLLWPLSAPVDHASSASQPDVDLSDGTTSSLTSLSPAPTRRYQEDTAADLRSYLVESLDTNRLIDLYLAEIHPHWPILHAPTFDPSSASAVLRGAMAMLANWLEGNLDHMELAPLVFDALATIPMEHSPTSFGRDVRPASLHALQALLLCVVYATYRLSEDGMLARAVHFNSILISTCRRLGIFSGQQHTHYGVGDSPFASWLFQEQLHRLSFSVLRVDAYLSLTVDHPPSVRYQEICIPFPMSTHLWTAASEDERHSLQRNEPAGYEKALFCFVVRDAIDFGRRRCFPYRLSKADYHLVTCSLQAGTWEAAREAVDACESDEHIMSDDHVQRWRTNLDAWRAHMENECQLRQNYFAACADHILSPLSLILCRMLSLTVHAPLKLLQYQGGSSKFRPGSPLTTQKSKARLQAWISSPCSRTAVWNAAQISRVVAHESTSLQPSSGLLLNPLAIPGILQSAIATCSYAYHTRACSTCTGGRPIESVDLFDTDDEDVKLARWKDKGEGLASWGPSRIPVCHCKVMDLATWFHHALARDKGADAELLSFLGRLRY